jgi:hypothetical protein
MILVCNIYKDVELKTDTQYLKIINLPYNFNISLYKNIGLGGIELEEELFKYDSMWGDNQKYSLCMLIWESENVEIEKIIKNIGQVKSDEIYFESINTNYNHNWVIGYKNAVVMFASAIMGADTLKLNNNKTIHKNLMTWMGNRIGLNVFEI